MTEQAAPQTPPRSASGGRHPSLIAERVCVDCRRLGVPVVADGRCWRDYQRRRRARRNAPAVQRRAERLEELAAAYGRIISADDAYRGELKRLRSRARLAYADGLSTFQLAPITHRSPMTVHRWLPEHLTAGRGAREGLFGGERASPEVVERWRPLLAEAATATDDAEDRKRDASASFRELLRQAAAPGSFGRVRPLDVAERLGITEESVAYWLHGRRSRARRCRGVRADGERCSRPASPDYQTCHWHRDQEEASSSLS